MFFAGGGGGTFLPRPPFGHLQKFLNSYLKRVHEQAGLSMMY